MTGCAKQLYELNLNDMSTNELIMKIENWNDREIVAEVIETIGADIQSYNNFEFGIKELFDELVVNETMYRSNALRTLERMTYSVSDQEQIEEVNNIFDLAKVQWYALRDEYWGIIYQGVQNYF